MRVADDNTEDIPRKSCKDFSHESDSNSEMSISTRFDRQSQIEGQFVLNEASGPLKAYYKPAIRTHYIFDDTFNRIKNLIYSLFTNPWRRRALVITISVLCLLLGGFYAFMAYYVPRTVQNSFSEFELSGNFPPTMIWGIEERAMHFNSTTTLAFTNFVDTTISFREPVEFWTDGAVVASMEFPEINFGYERPYLLSQNLTLNLIDTEKWKNLWKRWIARTVYDELPDFLKNDTIWSIKSVVDVKLLGMTMKNIAIEKVMPWNGGLSAGISPVKLAVSQYDIRGIPQTPSLRMVVNYQNFGSVGVNLGNFMFSLYSLYRHNSTYTSSVPLLDIMLEDFVFSPGRDNVTIQNDFLRDNAGSISAALQLGSNFLFNKTSIIVLKDFRTFYGYDRSVHWFNEVLRSMSFVISVGRSRPLVDIFRNKFAGIRDDLNAKVKQVMDFGSDDSTKKQGAWDTKPDRPWFGDSTNSSQADYDALNNLYKTSRSF